MIRVSPNNIIVTDPKASDGLSGMLIDLDLANEQGFESIPSAARNLAGTIQFMAIEVLRGKDHTHTYRHDLESFFYVLFWLVVRYGWRKAQFRGTDTLSSDYDLRSWSIGSFADIAMAKIGLVTIFGMEDIFEMFPEAFDVLKPLCRKLRYILFGDTVVIGTPPGDPALLYDDIIAIESL